MKISLAQLCMIMLCCTMHMAYALKIRQQKAKDQNPLLVVVLMVKNEAPVIRETLQPFVAAGVDHYFIFDTGSCDGTQEVVANFFAEHGIKNGIVAAEPFVDFATSRNRALELAEERFGDATFFLMLDAEWYICNVPTLLAFCDEHKEDPHDAFLIRIHTQDATTGRVLDFHLPRMFRPRAQLRFVGKIHEYLAIESAKKVPYEVCFDVRQSQHGVDATRRRLQRDLDILLKAYSEDSEDTRTIFFLAQTYVSLGDLLQAYHMFRLCTRKIHITPETSQEQREYAYQSHYNSGILAQELAHEDKRFTWQLIYEHFLDAFAVNPYRAEPLMCIAQHYWNEHDMHLCFVFARHAAELPYPINVTGIVETDVYTFRRYDLLGACAGNIGRWDVAEWAVMKALAAEPDKQHLRNNLAVIIERKAAQRSENSATIDHYKL